jgi:hypothetical protein
MSWNREEEMWSDAEYRKEVAKLKHIAAAALTTLEENEIADFLLLKDDQVRHWWQKHKAEEVERLKRIAERERRATLKAELLARLSDDEKELLGLTKQKQKRTYNY